MKNNRLLIAAFSLMLCLIVNVGITVAYFTDYEDARGGAVLHLSGRTEIEEKVDGKEKTISIKNVGDTDTVTRVMVVGEKVEVTLDGNWTGPEEDGWYYYKKVLTKGKSTSPIKAEVKVSGSEELKDYDIIVVHESQRVAYDGDKVAVPKGWKINSISAE